MNIAKIIPYDAANGPGIRTSIFVSGCRRNCPGCFNKEAQDFNYGHPCSGDDIKQVITLCSNIFADGLSFLGGEPFEPENEPVLTALAIKAKQRMLRSQDIWCWTGYTWEELTQNHEIHPLLAYIDVLVDGPFVEKRKDISLLWRGSSNQRIIDVKQTRLNHGHIVLWGSHE